MFSDSRLFRIGLAGLVAAATMATSVNAEVLRVESSLAGSEIVLRGPHGANSGIAPVSFENLEPGNYLIELWRHGSLTGSQEVTLRGGADLGPGRMSLGFRSTLLPGAGQFRERGWADAFLPFTSVIAPGALSLAFHGEASGREEEAVLLRERFASAPTDTGLALLVSRREDDAWRARQARNDYGILAGVVHFQQILHAAVPRGGVRYDLASGRNVRVSARNPGPAQLAFLSALAPGLGQARLGLNGRARLWQLLTVATGVTLVELQREANRESTRLNQLEQRASLGENGLESQMGAVRNAQASAESWREAVVVGAAALWALNVLEALTGDLPSTSASSFASDTLRLELASGGQVARVGVGWNF